MNVICKFADLKNTSQNTRWIVDGGGGFSKRVTYYIVVTFIFIILD